MNKELFGELKTLIDKKNKYEEFLKYLKGKTYYNTIELCKGMNRIYFEDDLIPILINYFENKIEEINQKISKFKLSKIID